MRHDLWHFVNLEVVLTVLDILLSFLHGRDEAIGHVLYILCQLTESQDLSNRRANLLQFDNIFLWDFIRVKLVDHLDRSLKAVLRVDQGNYKKTFNVQNSQNVIDLKTKSRVILTFQSNEWLSFCQGNAGKSHIEWVSTYLFHLAIVSTLFLFIDGVKKSSCMVHKQNSSQFVIEKFWEVLREILIQVLMSFGFHEDLHCGQNLGDTMSIVICAFLLVDFFQLEEEAVNYQPHLFDAVKRAEYFLAHVRKDLRRWFQNTQGSLNN